MPVTPWEGLVGIGGAIAVGGCILLLVFHHLANLHSGGTRTAVQADCKAFWVVRRVISNAIYTALEPSIV